MRFRRFTLAALLASVLWCDRAAVAGDDKHKAARRFFETGQLLYQRGRFVEAATEFERAYGEEPLPAFVYNAAQAYDKAGDGPHAIATYKQYLGFPASAADAELVRARIAVLEKAAAPPPPPAVVVVAPKHTPLPYVEPVTGHAFPTYMMADGKEFVLVGVGTRKVLGFKVYAMALYIEDEAARRGFPKLAGEAGGADSQTLLRSGLVPSFIIQGDFAKHAILWFARSVTAAKQRESYRDALGDDVGGKAAPEVRAAGEQFLALFDRDVKEGEEMAIHTNPDGKIGIDLGGKMKWGPTNLRIAHDIWDIWLGQKPINEDLKQALISRVDTLGR
jgi:tetratricopeptide (TPR) repeat protein